MSGIEPAIVAGAAAVAGTLVGGLSSFATSYFTARRHNGRETPDEVLLHEMLHASRKVRGGSGLHIGIGIALSFTYIMFQQVSKTFSTNGNLPAVIGVWIPNAIFGIVAAFLYRLAPK